MGKIYTFFARTKKVPKKYAEGVRTLSTPMSMGRYILFSLVRKKYQKSTRRVCAPSRLPWGWGTICTFFACTKKVPKKYTKGLRALSTPGDAVKFLRFDGDTGNFAVWQKRKIRSFSLPLSNCGLTHRCFINLLSFSYNDFWL